jgi:anti-sigma B factor antagonist
VAHFQADVDRRGDRTVVSFSGELDLEATTLAGAALRDAEDAGPEPIVVDLRPLTFIDSTGLSLLVGADRRARSAGRVFAVVPNEQPVRRLLEMLGVGGRLAVVDEPEARLPG